MLNMKNFLSHNSKYNIYNLLITPTIFVLVFGYYVTSIFANQYWDNILLEIIHNGYLFMILFHYPQKIIVMLYKGIINKKWEWGYSYKNWIFTVILTSFCSIVITKICNFLIICDLVR